MNDAGRIGFVIKGDYSSSTTYEFLDVVYYQNATYIARKTTTGVLPTVTTDWFCAVDADVNGLVHACTINPNASADYAADWLMENGAVVTPGSNDLYRVVVGGKDRLFFYNGTQYELVAGGGHTILNASTLPMAGRDNLQFENVKVVDDPTNNKTIIKPQFHVCATEAEWNQKTDAEKNDPLIYWVRPWANSDAFATDRTPVGTVVSIGCNETTIDPQDSLISFPNKDYLICKGTVCYINSYPQLANYIESAYGSKNYFGGDGTSTFAVPDWSADFPENGILCIKAQISSTVITYAEIDQSGSYAGEDKVPSCARVAEIENGLGDIESTFVTLPSAWGGASLVFTKRNGVVVVTRSGIIKNATINTDTQVGTIPNGYVPYTATNKIMYDYNSMMGNTYTKVPAIKLQFNPNGEIMAYGYITTGVSLNLGGYILSYITQN